MLTARSSIAPADGHAPPAPAAAGDRLRRRRAALRRPTVGAPSAAPSPQRSGATVAIARQRSSDVACCSASATPRTIQFSTPLIDAENAISSQRRLVRDRPRRPVAAPCARLRSRHSRPAVDDARADRVEPHAHPAVREVVLEPAAHPVVDDGVRLRAPAARASPNALSLSSMHDAGPRTTAVSAMFSSRLSARDEQRRAAMRAYAQSARSVSGASHGTTTTASAKMAASAARGEPEPASRSSASCRRPACRCRSARAAGRAASSRRTRAARG